MASGYVINIGNASANQWVQLTYEKTLNGVSNGQIGLDGINSAYASEFDVNKEIEIYKNGVGKFKGIVFDQDTMNGGGLILSFSGIELELTDDGAPMIGTATTRVWTTTSDETILSVLITSVSGWSVDFTNSTSATISSFRASASDSVWNCAVRLIEQTGKDIYVDQFTRTIYLYDVLTRANKFSFVEGKNAKDVSRVKSRSQAGKVLVYGKGDGENQIIGSYGSAKPVKKIIDRNIIAKDEADNRAEKEYNKLNPEGKNYKLTPTNYPSDLELGDSGNVSNNSARINDTVNIVRTSFSIDGNGTEKLTLEVTNPELRIANKNGAEESNSNQNNYDQSQSSMQGSGNTMTWGSGINAQFGTSTKVGFYIPEEFVTDQAGNIRIHSLTVDYDIDGYNAQYGDATFSGTDPQVQNLSGDEDANVSGSTGDDAPGVNGTTADETSGVSGTTGDENPDLDSGDSGYKWTGNIIGSDSDSSTSCSSGTWTTLVYVNTTNSDRSLWINFYVEGVSGGAEDISIRVTNTGYLPATRFEIYQDGFRDVCRVEMTAIGAGVNNYNDQIRVQVYPHSGAIVLGAWMSIYEADHEHSYGDYRVELHDHSSTGLTGSAHDHGASGLTADNHDHSSSGLSADNHDHPDGSYDINAADLDHISIGDSVSESETVNATSTNLYLEFWTGAEWFEKHSILVTEKIIDSDVDISNGGVYPDVAGYWRVRIEPNGVAPDFVQGIVKIKHNLDNWGIKWK